ncbi:MULTISPECIES: SRPBCC family protein [Parafrankia]|uniref:SRPBCC family protein n=1 Tax=Parafrankia TaxID=2994362 RepID=UPI001F6256AA|nr:MULTISPECIES: SRPBCC family protein [Parafrankia]
MSVVFLDASGPAPPQVCWERYAVPAAWPTWAPQIHAVTLADVPVGVRRQAAVPVGSGAGGTPSPPGWPGARRAPATEVRIFPGLRGRIRGLFPPTARFVITAVDETDRTWSWQVGVGPLRLELDHGVDACLDGGTSAWLRITAPALAIRAYAPIARAALRRLVR